MLSGLPKISDPNVLVGASTLDDAAVYRISDSLAVVQTLDFFTPVVDDPYWFGAIAAANSLSDVYAMGARPAFALSIVGFPRNKSDCPVSLLGEVLRGAADKAREAGIDICGGHTVDDNEPKFGLCVTGFVHPDQIWRNVGARPGDRLILTKALGTGLITTALRAERVSPEQVQAAMRSMSELNAQAAEVAKRFRVHACTDVTGFGFLGHLREMLGAGGIGARIHLPSVPMLPGLGELIATGNVPGGARRNEAYVRPCLRRGDSVRDAEITMLCDPQTSGGLLFAVDCGDADPFLAGLQQSGVARVADVGEIIESADGAIHVVA